MSLSVTQQRNGVSEGAALGLVIHGRQELAYDKVRIDLAFAGAWRNWGRWAARFGQVSTDLSKGTDPIRALTRADVRKHTFSLYWQIGQPLLICARAQWQHEPLDAPAAAAAIDRMTPADAWADLAGDFLARFDRRYGT